MENSVCVTIIVSFSAIIIAFMNNFYNFKITKFLSNETPKDKIKLIGDAVQKIKHKGQNRSLFTIFSKNILDKKS